jgi:hypothetical protein
MDQRIGFTLGMRMGCVGRGIVQCEGTMWLRRRLEEKRCANIVSIFMAKKVVYFLKTYYHKKFKDSALSGENVSSSSQFYVAALCELLMVVC